MPLFEVFHLVIINSSSVKLKLANAALIEDDVPFHKMTEAACETSMAVIAWCLMNP